MNLLKIFWVVYILLEFLIAEVILKENRSILFEQIKCIKQLKCIKYLWIGEKIEKEVNGEDRCIGAWRTTFLRSGRHGWLRWAWWVHAWEGEGRAESYLCLELWWYEVGVIVLVLSLMKRVVAFAIKSWAWCDFSLIVGPSNVYLFTKMSWKLSFHNLKTLKNQKIEWWKQKLKTNPNKPFCYGTHQFWVMGNENRVMGDRKHEIQTALSLCT